MKVGLAGFIVEGFLFAVMGLEVTSFIFNSKCPFVVDCMLDALGLEGSSSRPLWLFLSITRGRHICKQAPFAQGWLLEALALHCCLFWLVFDGD